jgi:hypothetical protein
MVIMKKKAEMLNPKSTCGSLFLREDELLLVIDNDTCPHAIGWSLKEMLQRAIRDADDYHEVKAIKRAFGRIARANE